MITLNFHLQTQYKYELFHIYFTIIPNLNNNTRTSLASHSCENSFVLKHECEAKGGGKGGNIVADTLLLMTFPCARKLGNICCGHKMFVNKIRNIFCVKKNCVRTIVRAGKRGNICVGNNVSATMCPRLPVPRIYKI